MSCILLVDDDESMLLFIEKALKNAGYDVSIAHNAVEALDILNESDQGNFDLLLTDIVMPGMDGIELSRKAVKKDPALKVMFMTGFSAITMNQKDVKDNVELVSKPFHLNDLIAQIRAALAQ